jgi:hypothetical protein
MKAISLYYLLCIGNAILCLGMLRNDALQKKMYKPKNSHLQQTYNYVVVINTKNSHLRQTYN